MYSEDDDYIRACNGEECMWGECESTCCLDCPNMSDCMYVCSNIDNCPFP